MKAVIYAVVIVLGMIAFAKFETWHNREYYANRCAGYGYEADCKTPLNK